MLKRAFLIILYIFDTTASLFAKWDMRDETIYFVITTRFYDGDPSNNTQCWDAQALNDGDPAWRGDFKGLIEKLDYIKALGFSAIWITPVVENASGYDYHGYHAHDFSKVDKRYESENVTFQTLVNEVHKRGMKLIVDIVLQHTGNFGEAHLCPLFERDWTADQSDIDACMKPLSTLPANYSSMSGGEQYAARLAMMKNSDGSNHDYLNHYHHYSHFNWDDPNRWFGQIAGDCVDLNTENPAVYNYLISCYTKLIKAGVDGFRIDTGGHIPRLTFNKAFIPALNDSAQKYSAARGGGEFFMFAEVCARYTSIWYREQPNLSPLYYTWKESKDYQWDSDSTSWSSVVAMEGDDCTSHLNWQSVWLSASDDLSNISSQRTSTNAFLNGNNYHTPDYSQYSGLSVIDFTLHHNFANASSAWNVLKQNNDKYYNDARFNVTYIDSHDYAPNGAPENCRFSGSIDTWAENLSLMFTHRGIPCLYYGSEIEFRKGYEIDAGTNKPLKETGRAYFGGYLTGNVEVTDFGVYQNASGNVAATLSHPLASHIRRLNQLRRAIPALRKGQYSYDGCSGTYAFKRRYKDATTDSYALITISSSATFTNIENGTYICAVTGDRVVVTNNKLSVNCSGKGNLRVYVLDTEQTPAPGKVGEDGKFIYGSSSINIPYPKWDGNEEDGVDFQPNTPNYERPCLDNEDEQSLFFVSPAEFGSVIYCYAWKTENGVTTQYCGSWPGKKATCLGSNIYRYTFEEPIEASGIIWNNGSGCQTKDLDYTLHGLYGGTNRNDVAVKYIVDELCENVPTSPNKPDKPDNPTPDPDKPDVPDAASVGSITQFVAYSAEDKVVVNTENDIHISIYSATGMLISSNWGAFSISLPRGIYVITDGITTIKLAHYGR